MFKNATIFSLSHLNPFPVLPWGELDEHKLREPGPLEMETVGFVSPLGGDGKLAVTVDGATSVTVGTWKRALPMAAVRAELAKLLDATEKSTGRRPGGRERKQLMSTVLERMMPNAPIVPGRVNAIIDPLLKAMIVDTSSRAVAEQVAHMLRTAFGSFNVLPINAEQLPSEVMTRKILMNNDKVFQRGSMVELKQAVTNGEAVRITNGELESDEVYGYVRSGLSVSRIEVSTDRVSLVLGEDLVLRKIKLSDVVLEELPGDAESMEEELQARMALAIGELRKLLAQVYTLFTVRN